MTVGIFNSQWCIIKKSHDGLSVNSGAGPESLEACTYNRAEQTNILRMCSNNKMLNL